MIETIIGQIKNPVKTILKKSEEEDLKRGMIKLAIISAIMAFINVCMSVVAIIEKYSKKSIWYRNYSSSELWEKRWESIKSAGLVGGFFRMFIIIGIAIAVGALILFVISKIVKSEKKYTTTLSMVNSFFSIYIVGQIFNLIFSFIYAPLGWLVLFASGVYASFALINAYRDSLNIENIDTLVLATTGVLTATVVILVIVFLAISGVSLSDLSSVSDLLKVF